MLLPIQVFENSTQDIVYNQNIFGRSSYNLPYTVSHISCFLQGESQVQPPKYKIQTHTHTYKYNRLSFKSKNPPEINMAIEPNPKPSCLRQQATPLSALVAILVGVLVGLLVRWLLRCWLIATILGWIINRRWICCQMTTYCTIISWIIDDVVLLSTWFPP